jgi:hypothetical protein
MMNRFLLSAAVMSLSLALTGAATAADHGRGSHFSGGSFGGSSFHSSTSYWHGSGSHDFRVTHNPTFYRGKDHFSGSSRYWDRRYGCYTYWCPSTYCYYYWCQPDDCYYPINYCPYGKYCW